VPRRRLILVKHGQPVLDPSVPPREWRLGREGEEQSQRLAERLRIFLPFILVSSPEPKAARTAQIVGARLGITPSVVDGLEEFDRPAMPIVSSEEHERLNAGIFTTRTLPALGRESADAALARFTTAIDQALVSITSCETLVVVSHGTVIALYVEQTSGRDAFDVWKTLSCGDFIVHETGDGPESCRAEVRS
jgi:2,3-bisphosphoglycerate-dependent phosphoglycerate mutase